MTLIVYLGTFRWNYCQIGSCVVVIVNIFTFFQFVIIFSWVKYTDIEGEAFPDWADALGWMMTLTVIVAIIGGAIFTLCTAEGTFSQVKFSLLIAYCKNAECYALFLFFH